MREEIVRITTHDTKKVYEYPTDCSKLGNAPELWQVKLEIRSVSQFGHVNTAAAKTNVVVYLERPTLEAAGLLPRYEAGKNVAEVKETPQDLLLRLLSLVEVYPNPE